MPPVRKRNIKRRPKTSQEEKRTVRSSEHPPQTHSEKYGYKISHGPDQHNVEPADHQAPHAAASYTMPEKSSVPEEKRRVSLLEGPPQIYSEEYGYKILHGRDQHNVEPADHQDPHTAASYTVPEKSSVAEEMTRVRFPKHPGQLYSEEFGSSISYGLEQHNVELADRQAPHPAASYTVPEKSSLAEEMRRFRFPEHPTQLYTEEFGSSLLYGPDKHNVELADRQDPHPAASTTVPEKSSVAEEMRRFRFPEHPTQLYTEEFGSSLLYGPDKHNVELADRQDPHPAASTTVPEKSSVAEEMRRFRFPEHPTQLYTEEFGSSLLYGPDKHNVELADRQDPHPAASTTVPEKSSVAEEMRRFRFPEHPAQLYSEEFGSSFLYGPDQRNVELPDRQAPHTAASYTGPEKSSVAEEMRRFRFPEHPAQLYSEEFGSSFLYGPDQRNVELPDRQAPHTAASYTGPEKSSVAEEMRRFHFPEHPAQLYSEEFGSSFLYGLEQHNVELADRQSPHPAASSTIPEKSSVAEEMRRIRFPKHPARLYYEEFRSTILYGPEQRNIELADRQPPHTAASCTVPEKSSVAEEMRRFHLPEHPAQLYSEEFGSSFLYGPDQRKVELADRQAPHTSVSYTVPEKSSVAEEKRRVRLSEDPPEIYSEEYGYNILHGPDQHNVEQADNQVHHTPPSDAIPEKSSVAEEKRRVHFSEDPPQIYPEEYGYNILHGPDQHNVEQDDNQVHYTAPSDTVPEKSSVAEEKRRVHFSEHPSQTRSKECRCNVSHGPDQPNVEPADDDDETIAPAFRILIKSLPMDNQPFRIYRAPDCQVCHQERRYYLAQWDNETEPEENHGKESHHDKNLDESVPTSVDQRIKPKSSPRKVAPECQVNEGMKTKPAPRKAAPKHHAKEGTKPKLKPAPQKAAPERQVKEGIKPTPRKVPPERQVNKDMKPKPAPQKAAPKQHAKEGTKPKLKPAPQKAAPERQVKEGIKPTPRKVPPERQVNKDMKPKPAPRKAAPKQHAKEGTKPKLKPAPQKAAPEHRVNEDIKPTPQKVAPERRGTDAHRSRHPREQNPNDSPQPPHPQREHHSHHERTPHDSMSYTEIHEKMKRLAASDKLTHCDPVISSARYYLRQLRKENESGQDRLSHTDRHYAVADALGLVKPPKKEEDRPNTDAIDMAYEEVLRTLKGKNISPPRVHHPNVPDNRRQQHETYYKDGYPVNAPDDPYPHRRPEPHPHYFVDRYPPDIYPRHPPIEEGDSSPELFFLPRKKKGIDKATSTADVSDPHAVLPHFGKQDSSYQQPHSSEYRKAEHWTSYQSAYDSSHNPRGDDYYKGIPTKFFTSTGDPIYLETRRGPSYVQPQGHSRYATGAQAGDQPSYQQPYSSENRKGEHGASYESAYDSSRKPCGANYIDNKHAIFYQEPPHSSENGKAEHGASYESASDSSRKPRADDYIKNKYAKFFTGQPENQETRRGPSYVQPQGHLRYATGAQAGDQPSYQQPHSSENRKAEHGASYESAYDSSRNPRSGDFSKSRYPKFFTGQPENQETKHGASYKQPYSHSCYTPGAQTGYQPSYQQPQSSENGKGEHGASYESAYDSSRHARGADYIKKKYAKFFTGQPEYQETRHGASYEQSYGDSRYPPGVQTGYQPSGNKPSDRSYPPTEHIRKTSGSKGPSSEGRKSDENSESKE